MSARITDRDSWCTRLMREHDAAVRRLAASMERDPARRQDLLQEIWLAVWQALPRFRGDCSERTFVFRIAHNRAVSHVLHWQRRRTEPLGEDLALASPALDPERLLSDQERRIRLQTAVCALPMGLRQVVVLTLEGLTNREAAEVIGISENNVAVRLTRARVALARELASREELE